MRRTACLLLLVVVGACKPDYHFDPPDREGRVVEAEGLYNVALFDTIGWADDNARVTAGNEVFARKCRNCHGPLGRGGTAYAQQRALQVPSLVQPDWRYAESMDSVRHRIFVGHAQGMPTWGVAGIEPREIDAVAYYILDDLRPEVLGGN